MTRYHDHFPLGQAYLCENCSSITNAEKSCPCCTSNRLRQLTEFLAPIPPAPPASDPPLPDALPQAHGFLGQLEGIATQSDTLETMAHYLERCTRELLDPQPAGPIEAAALSAGRIPRMSVDSDASLSPEAELETATSRNPAPVEQSDAAFRRGFFFGRRAV